MATVAFDYEVTNVFALVVVPTNAGWAVLSKPPDFWPKIAVSNILIFRRSHRLDAQLQEAAGRQAH